MAQAHSTMPIKCLAEWLTQKQPSGYGCVNRELGSQWSFLLSGHIPRAPRLLPR